MQQHFASLLILFLMGVPHACLALSSAQDTDGDGIPDLQEDANGNGVIDLGETDPYNADSDGGGESDGVERATNRNPLDQRDDLTFDADGDGLVNGIELLRNTDSTKPDTDGDGINDPQDPFPLDSKFQKDDNNNGLPDEWEKITGLDKKEVMQTTTDDPDGDGLKNAEELARNTNPLTMDTDYDGIDDSTEILQGTNPREHACLSRTAELPRMFADMENHWAAAYVSTLLSVQILPENTPIIRGYDQPTKQGHRVVFAPDQPVTRYEFLKMMLLSSCVKLRTYTNREAKEFTDVRMRATINENPDFAFRRSVIYTAAHERIIDGYDDGSFRPDAPISRAEAMKILAMAAHLSLSQGSGSLLPTTFRDILSSDWFAPYVAMGAEHGIVQGYDDGTFRPDRSITRAEAAKIIALALRQNPYVNGYIVPE